MALPQLINGLQAIKNTEIFSAFSMIPEIGNTANIKGIQLLLEMEEKGIAAYDEMIEAVGQGEKIADGLEDI